MSEVAAEGIFRAMAEEGGMPKLSTGAVFLGIRRGKDIDPDPTGKVHRPAFLPLGKNGLSCAPTIASLPLFALPVEWGGSNNRTAVWQIEAVDLAPVLVAVEDSVTGRNRHVSIGPSSTMEYDEFVRAIEATRPLWKKVAKN